MYQCIPYKSREYFHAVPLKESSAAQMLAVRERLNSSVFFADNEKITHILNKEEPDAELTYFRITINAAGILRIEMGSDRSDDMIQARGHEPVDELVARLDKTMVECGWIHKSLLPKLSPKSSTLPAMDF